MTLTRPKPSLRRSSAQIGIHVGTGFRSAPYSLVLSEPGFRPGSFLASRREYPLSVVPFRIAESSHGYFTPLFLKKQIVLKVRGFVHPNGFTRDFGFESVFPTAPFRMRELRKIRIHKDFGTLSVSLSFLKFFFFLKRTRIYPFRPESMRIYPCETGFAVRFLLSRAFRTASRNKNLIYYENAKILHVCGFIQSDSTSSDCVLKVCGFIQSESESMRIRPFQPVPGVFFLRRRLSKGLLDRIPPPVVLKICGFIQFRPESMRIYPNERMNQTSERFLNSCGRLSVLCGKFLDSRPYPRMPTEIRRYADSSKRIRTYADSSK